MQIKMRNKEILEENHFGLFSRRTWIFLNVTILGNTYTWTDQPVIELLKYHNNAAFKLKSCKRTQKKHKKAKNLRIRGIGED